MVREAKRVADDPAYDMKQQPRRRSRSPHDEQPPQLGQSMSPGRASPARRRGRIEEPPSPKVQDWPRLECTLPELRGSLIDIATNLIGQIRATNERIDVIEVNGEKDHTNVQEMKPKILKLEQDSKRISEQCADLDAHLNAMGRPPQQLKDLPEFITARLETVDQMTKDLDARSNQMKKDMSNFGKIVADDADYKEQQLKRLTNV